MLSCRPSVLDIFRTATDPNFLNDETVKKYLIRIKQKLKSSPLDNNE